MEFAEFIQDPTQQACMYFGSWVAAYGLSDALGIVHGPSGCRSHVLRTFMNIDKVGNRLRFVISSVGQDEVIFGGRQVLLETIKSVYEKQSPKLIAIITTCASEIINDNVQAVIEEAKKTGIASHMVYFPSPGFKGDDFDGFDNSLRVLAEDLVSANPAKTIAPTVNYIGHRFNSYEYGSTGAVAEIQRVLKGIGVSVHSVWTSGQTHEAIETSAGADLNITTPLLGKSACQVLKERFGTPFLELLPPYGLEGTARFLRMVADHFGSLKLAEQFIENELRDAANRITCVAEELSGKRAAIFANPLDAMGYANLAMELGLEPVLIGITRPIDPFTDDYLRTLFQNSRGPKLQPTIGYLLHHKIPQLLTETEVEVVLGSSHETYIADALGIPAVNVAWPIFNETMITERFYLGFKGAVLLAEAVANLILRRKATKLYGAAT